MKVSKAQRIRAAAVAALVWGGANVAADALPSKLSSKDATDHPLDLYGRHPSAEAIIANASAGLDYTRPGSGWTNHTRFMPKENTVLAYVTPWNQPRGRENAEYYRGKLDIVSPTWYTVVTVPPEEQVQRPQFEETAMTGDEYRVEGGPPTEEDKAWVKRLQSSVKTKAGEKLPPVKVCPRFLLDKWQEKDFKDLRSDPLRWMSIIMKMTDVIAEGKYDGVVLDSAANWMFPEFVEHLGTTFQKQNLTLVVVFQPLKPRADEPGANEALAKAIRMLASKVDFVHIMTYDYAPTGIPVDVDKLRLAPENPLRTEPDIVRMRTIAPNQPIDFLRSNIENLAGSSSMLEAMPGMEEELGLNTGAFMPPMALSEEAATNLQERTVDETFSRKFLFGLPMYGYSFPVMWLDKKTANGLPRVPTASPPKARANLTEAQEAQRGVGYRKEAGKFPLLRKPGLAFTHTEMHGWMAASRPLVYLDDESNELRFDYIAPNEEDEGSGPDGRKEGIYWRAYMPSAYAMIKRREMLEQERVGAALWDIGQAAPWLLHAL